MHGKSIFYFNIHLKYNGHFKSDVNEIHVYYKTVLFNSNGRALPPQ